MKTWHWVTVAAPAEPEQRPTTNGSNPVIVAPDGTFIEQLFIPRGRESFPNPSEHVA
jgi:hypothetical protein